MNMSLEELVRQLTLAHGEALHCVALYGSAVRGEQISRKPNLNVLVLVSGIDMDHLRREAPVARAWSAAGHPPPLTLTMSEWRTSSDIFPMEYADILAHHRILQGALPPERPAVQRNDLRLQLEHETLSKLLRLRHAVLSSGAAPKALLAMLEGSASSIMALLRAALRLAGEEPPAQSSAVLERLEAISGINGSTFRRVLDHARGDAVIRDADANSVTANYLVSVAELVRWVDAQGP